MNARPKGLGWRGGAVACALLALAGLAGVPTELAGPGARRAGGAAAFAPVAGKAGGVSPAVTGLLRVPGDDDGAQASVRAALAEAAASKREAQKLDGAEREQALLAVTARYAAIAEDAAFAAAGRAEAAFRAGELLRLDKHLDEAEVMFRRATELGDAGEGGQEYAARGLLECAHLARRARAMDEALKLYGEVTERYAAERRSAAHAVTWRGKLQLQAGQRDEGVATLLGFLEQFPEYPAEAVRNADLVALEQLEAGDEAGARATVARINAAMEGVVAQGGKQAEQVSKALTGMRVTEQLSGY